MGIDNSSSLKKRVVTAAYLLPPVVLLILFGGIPLTLFSLIVFTIINFEFYTLTNLFPKTMVRQLTLCSLLLALGYLWKSWFGLSAACVLAIMLILLLHVLYVEREAHEVPFAEMLPAAMLGLCYTGLLGTVFIAAIGQISGLTLLWFLLVIISIDTGAYFGGSYFGGAKLAERISPKKTISGAIVGLFCASITAVLLGILFEHQATWFTLVCFGLLIGVISVFGDLVESLIKRIYHAKDSGNLLPGHGGLLDRIDALLFASPILFFVYF